jgi:acetyl-CoA carboxylase biotin carboxyl carrier protein
MSKDTKASNDPLEARLIRDLAGILEETGLTEIEIEKAGLRVRVARTISVSAVAAPAPVHFNASPVAQASAPAAGPAKAAEAGGQAGVVTSPMVGTAYLAPSPGAAAFVKVGDTVKEGQTLLIIEAMKTMNQIPAPRAGTLRRILIEDGTPVEYGAPLMIID